MSGCLVMSSCLCCFVLCASLYILVEYVACLVMSTVFVACACTILIEYVAEGHVKCFVCFETYSENILD